MVSTTTLEQSDTTADRKTALQAFSNIINYSCHYCGIPAYSPQQTVTITVELYDHCLEYFDAGIPPTTLITLSEFQTDLQDDKEEVETKMGFLMKAIQVLDTDNTLRPLILDHPLDTDDDYETVLGEHFPSSRLTSSQASLYRILAITIFALGLAFNEIGNKTIGFHMLILAAKIQERVIRTAPKVTVDSVNDRRTSSIFYQKITKVAMLLGEFEQAADYATKLVSRFDLAVAQLFMYTTSSENGVDDLTTTMTDDAKEIDLGMHYESLLILAVSAEKSQQPKTALNSYMQALELFAVEKRISKVGAIVMYLQGKDELPITQNQEEVLIQSETLQLKLCLRLIETNEKTQKEALTSLNYSRFALEHYTLIQASNGSTNDVTECHLQYLIGRMAYNYALTLAGGMQQASSPPIAILAPDANTPSIRSLLEESFDMLEEAVGSAEPGFNDSNCQESILLQLAIVATELRLDEKAKQFLKTTGSDSRILNEWDMSRKNSTDFKTHPHFNNVIYSAEVFKRILSILPNDTSHGKPPALTLSRKRTVNFDHPVKVQCSYCSMQCINTDIKCEVCAIGKVFVWYCTEECKLDHKEQHEAVCLRNKSEMSSQSPIPPIDTVLSFLNLN